MFSPFLVYLTFLTLLAQGAQGSILRSQADLKRDYDFIIVGGKKRKKALSFISPSFTPCSSYLHPSAQPVQEEVQYQIDSQRTPMYLFLYSKQVERKPKSTIIPIHSISNVPGICHLQQQRQPNHRRPSPLHQTNPKHPMGLELHHNTPTQLE